MSIKMLARDLYRCQQEVDRLEKRLADAPPEERNALTTDLHRARAERDLLRKALDGQKQS